MLPIFDGVRDVTVLSTTLRMLLAVVCGGLIGLEREPVQGHRPVRR